MRLEKGRQTGGPAGTFWRRLFPFLRWWNFIGWDTLRADAVAGLTGAVIVLPQGVAFAMIAGLPPEIGLYTAMAVPVVAALFGSSLHLISGPTTAISIVVFSSLSPLAEPGSAAFIRLAITLTFLAGAFQLGLGLARMGILVNFVSHSVILGFTSGAAILIITSQMGPVLGIPMPRAASFFEAWRTLAREMTGANPYSAMVAGTALACALIFKRLRPRWPGLLFALMLGSLAALLLGAESRGVRLMEAIPGRLPPLSLPNFSMETLRELAPKGFAVALIGLVEALSIARSIAAFSRQPIDGSQEFIGQGLSNIAGSFFSCYAGSGSFTRSGINYQSGAMTPLSAVFASAFLALILILVAPLTGYLPVPAMAGVILLVAYHLIDFRHIRAVIRTSPQEAAIMTATFLSALVLDLEFAIYVGVILSLLFYLRRTAHPEIISLSPDRDAAGGPMAHPCPALKIIRIDGSLFFGAVNHITEFLQHIDKSLIHKAHLLIVAYGIHFIDITGAEMLVNEARRRRGGRGDLYLCGLKPQAAAILERGGYLDDIGRDHVFASESEAIAGILARIDHPACRNCQNPAFAECKR